MYLLRKINITVKHNNYVLILFVDLCKSMVDLVEDNGGETATTPSSLYVGEVFSSGTDITDSSDNIHIVVDGATTESSSDFGLQTQEYDQFLNEYYGGNVPQVRHRSPVPTKQNGVEDQDSESRMLIHGNKRFVIVMTMTIHLSHTNIITSSPLGET